MTGDQGEPVNQLAILMIVYFSGFDVTQGDPGVPGLNSTDGANGDPGEKGEQGRKGRPGLPVSEHNQTL